MYDNLYTYTNLYYLYTYTFIHLYTTYTFTYTDTGYVASSNFIKKKKISRYKTCFYAIKIHSRSKRHLFKKIKSIMQSMRKNQEINLGFFFNIGMNYYKSVKLSV